MLFIGVYEMEYIIFLIICSAIIKFFRQAYGFFVYSC